MNTAIAVSSTQFVEALGLSDCRIWNGVLVTMPRMRADQRASDGAASRTIFRTTGWAFAV